MTCFSRQGLKQGEIYASAQSIQFPACCSAPSPVSAQGAARAVFLSLLFWLAVHLSADAAVEALHHAHGSFSRNKPK
jgi:hypothetical protein